MKYERITGQKWSENIDLKQELGYSYIYKRLHELEDDLENGKIVRLPCKVGDTVYIPWNWDNEQGIATVEIEEIKFYDTQMHYMFFIDLESDDEDFNQTYGGWKIEQSIGKTVFLTREEAEAKLKELQK